MSTTIGLAIPQPSQLVDVVNLCQSIEAQLPYVDDVGQLKDAAAKLRAIDEYLSVTNVEGRKAIVATIRHIDIRAGEVLGVGVVGRPPQGEIVKGFTISELSNVEKRQLRLMAQHPDIVEQVIEESTDQRPASRLKVITAIKESVKRDQQMNAEALASRGIKPLTDPAEIAKARAWIDMDAAVAGAIAHVLKVSARYSNDDLERLTTGRLWQSTREDASRASAFLKYLSTLGAST
jgi:hypothetical protein